MKSHRDDIAFNVAEWNRFGPDVWTDDRTLVFDYLAYLWSRDRLERAIQAADPHTASAIRERIAHSDERFRDSSDAVDPGLASRYRQPDAGWWWHRTPKELGRALRPELT